jgi:2,5-diamino-6-(ribosylamino)-4(3H)-pyrimidinone 5'-phosphate reductase
MLPRVLLHVAASLDGRTDWIAPDLGQFYRVAARWGDDCILTGADTILASPGYEEDAPAGDEAPSADQAPAGTPEGDRLAGRHPRPLLAVVDGRGRVHGWRYLRAQHDYWRTPVALVCAGTSGAHIEEVRRAGCSALLAGGERVDLRAALEGLVEHFGVTRVRVDSGGALAGALLRAGLVHEVSVLVQPVLVGGESPRSFYRAPDLAGSHGVVRLRLDGVEPLDDGVVLLLYEVAGGG